MSSQFTETPVLLDINAITELLRISNRTARRLVNEPGFPRRVRIRACVRWSRDEVLAYLESLKDDATATKPGKVECGGDGAAGKVEPVTEESQPRPAPKLLQA